MKILQPHSGMVIAYSFLWSQEHTRGCEEGRKNRPCIIVQTLEDDCFKKQVIVLPITSKLPVRGSFMRLTTLFPNRPGYIILNESNFFKWPGSDLREVPKSHPPTCVYGVLTNDMTRKLRAEYGKAMMLGEAVRIDRTCDSTNYRSFRLGDQYVHP